MNRSTLGSIPYIPGHPLARAELIGRHLPPIPERVVSTWLHMNAAPDTWVLDPFGSSPRVALEAAQAGYRVLVAANNPIIRFLIEVMASPPSEDELKAALADLAASFIGEERIEPHIRSLYNTTCARCGQVISAEAFLWEHGNPTPYARIYTCPNCGDSGEHPCTSFDAEYSSQFTASGLHKARALERVVALNDQDRIHVEQALSIYNPRALYGLITIINKLQGLNISIQGRKYLEALLLYTFDQANSMWRPQAQTERRRQLSIPRHSRENNIWCALEEGIDQWSAESIAGMNSPVPVAIWPNLPSAAGVSIYEGRLVNLIDSIKNLDIEVVCTALPRPNQAYWTLSALWAGWLWGREAVGKFKSVLHRQRYDWAWHATALASVFKQLTNFLKPSTLMFGLLGETEPGFIGSAVVAAAYGGCNLVDIALRPEDKQAQIIWKSDRSHELSQIGPVLSQIANQSARRYLEICAEPVSYLSAISAALVGIVNYWHASPESQVTQPDTPISDALRTTSPAAVGEPSPSLTYSSAYNAAREALSYRSGFLRYSLQESIIESATKSQMQQTTLFTMDSGNVSEPDDETIPTEPPPSESDTGTDKQRPTRSSDVSESSLIWLRETGKVNQRTSTDNYETFLFDYLASHPGCTPQEIDQAMCAAFPGLFTPDAAFIRLCLDSYGLPMSQDANHWSLRTEDDPSVRQADIAQINRIIHQVGSELNFSCTDRSSGPSNSYVCWRDEQSGQEYWFFTTSSAVITEIVILGEQPPTKGFIVFPASRANILIYKLRRDPRLNKAFNPSQGVWQFLKFRHLRSLHESAALNRDNLEQMLGLDPLTFTTPQLWLI